MSRPQSKVNIPFPVNGITELGPYEGQPDRTTPNAKNVRGFAWVDNGGTPERGRLGGGQRPGIRNFHSGGNKVKATSGRDGHSIQDINHISTDAVEVLSGRDEFPMRGITPATRVPPPHTHREGRVEFLWIDFRHGNGVGVNLG